VKHALDGGEDVLLLDVREPNEYAEGHLPGAVNVPRGMLETAMSAGLNGWAEAGLPLDRQ
jgi:rhodanese-related sulfurtransferase